jgi:DNA-directed RNA polymerase specialized sigma24 family protein
MEDNQQNSSDIELLDELRKGRNENEAATELYRRHSASLTHLIVHSLWSGGCMSPQDHAEDVIASAWINILSHVSDLKDASYFEAWLTHIARNVAREHLTACLREQPGDEPSKVESQRVHSSQACCAILYE